MAGASRAAGRGLSAPEETRPTFAQSFSRSQITSAVATAADFGLLFSLTEIFHVWYVPAVALGALVGAVTNFFLNRHWSFAASQEVWQGQALRYSLVSAGSLLLNTAGTWFVTEYVHVHYSLSVITVSIAVGFFFNYPMQRHFVFK
jgi:putative flippase GtrA